MKTIEARESPRLDAKTRAYARETMGASVSLAKPGVVRRPNPDRLFFQTCIFTLFQAILQVDPASLFNWVWFSFLGFVPIIFLSVILQQRDCVFCSVDVSRSSLTFSGRPKASCHDTVSTSVVISSFSLCLFL